MTYLFEEIRECCSQLNSAGVTVTDIFLGLDVNLVVLCICVVRMWVYLISCDDYKSILFVHLSVC